MFTSKFKKINSFTDLETSCPMEVIFIGKDNHGERIEVGSGILFNGHLICSCCGELIEEILLSYDDIWIMEVGSTVNHWIDFSQEIGSGLIEELYNIVENNDTDYLKELLSETYEID